MVAVTRIQECAEAVCSALYETDFQFLGETNGGATTWFTRGAKPRTIRVSVNRNDLGFVVIVVEWANLSLPGKVIKGSETLRIKAGATATASDVTEGSYQAIVRTLEIFKDVLAGKGVAGPEALSHLTFE